MVLRIGNAQGFWGDSPTAPATLIEQQPDLDYITLDYLAEVSMSIMAIQKEKNPNHGYALDFVDVIRSLIPHWKNGGHFKVISNAGGLNPIACATVCAELLKEELDRPIKIGVVHGDDVLIDLKNANETPFFANLETGEPLSLILPTIVTANAYLGAKSIAEALSRGADIVITGRIADPSLTVGPFVYHYGCSWTDFDEIAGATVAGHLIECGTQVTGGISTNWLDMPDPAGFGFPFVEINEDGSFIITKPERTGGCVTAETVKEQLLYEIGDPDSYLSPDVTVSFLSLQVKDQGNNRVHVKGAKGRLPPSTYKVSATYRDGYKSEAMLTIVGPEAARKAQLCGEVILERLRMAGIELEHTQIECLGAGGLAPGVLQSIQPPECVLRICACDPHYEALEAFGKEIAPMVTSGPQGVTGYTSGRPRIRNVFGYWPCLIPCHLVQPHVNIFEVKP